jgi:hypothetical protein
LFQTVGALAVPGYRSAEVCKSHDEAVLFLPMGSE